LQFWSNITVQLGLHRKQVPALLPTSTAWHVTLGAPRASQPPPLKQSHGPVAPFATSQ
jgi:hypothetical protein